MLIEGKNAGAMLRLTEALEEHDDVQNVFSNFDDEEGLGADGVNMRASSGSTAA